MAIANFTLANRLHAGETVYSGWCGLPYPIVAETLARDGFSAVTIESQHGLWDTGGILNGIAAVRQGGAAPPWRIAATPLRMLPVSHRPCWLSTVTATKPSRASVSATSG